MAPPLTRRQGTEKVALPQWIRPQLTRLVDAAPEGDQWLHEIKFDGYRMHARLDRGSVRLLTRTGLDWTHKYPAIAAAVAALIRPISTANCAACVPTASPPSA
jgi:ATP-dependent DNA ligase